MRTWTMYNRKLFVLAFPVFIQGFIDNIHTPLVKELFFLHSSFIPGVKGGSSACKTLPNPPMSG